MLSEREASKQQIASQELLPLYAWLVASLQDSRGFSSCWDQTVGCEYVAMLATTWVLMVLASA